MRTLLAAILIAMPFAAFADETGIQIDHVWARAAPAGHEGAVYLTITDGGAPDTLTGVTTPVAAEAARASEHRRSRRDENAPGGTAADRTWQAGDARAGRLSHHAVGAEAVPEARRQFSDHAQLREGGTR